MIEELRPRLSAAFLGDFRELLLAAATSRDAAFASEGVRRRIEQLRAHATDTDAPSLRELLDVLEAGPETPSERALCRHAALLAMDTPEAPHYAPDLVWLAANTPYSVFEDLDHAQTIDQDALWDQITAYAQRALRQEPSAWRRGELLLAMAAISHSDHPRARAQREALHELGGDPLATRILGDGVSGVELTCSVHTLPRNAALTWLYGMTGILLLTSLGRSLGRTLFGIERGARLRVTPQAIDLRSFRTVRGQGEGEVRTFMPRASLASVTREPRRARLPMLAGALGLLVGTAFGTGSLIEAARGGAPSLIVFGLSALALGFVADYVLVEAWPKRRAQVRLLVRPQTGPAFRLDEVDEAAAERVMILLQRST